MSDDLTYIDFRKNSQIALSDKNLREALKNATDRFRALRASTVESVSDWESLRNYAREVKEHTMLNLDNYLELLEESITKAGGKVHWARDGEEANEIITQLAKDNGVKLVVKSKSMATEEIELNQAFEANGIKVVETDLGEYIIQLEGERPSHIIAPAIHKTKKDISALFQKKLGVPYLEKPEDLTKIAREILREEFLNADMGVSGVNFAVAETGTLVIVENEGNVRLTTTVPKIHVAVMGIEKIIPKFHDLSIFLNLLIKSATGQNLSTYISFITGPKKEQEIDGPEQLHLVLLDNGRTSILRDPEMRESLYCLKCGACLNICPVYRQVGGHAYGSVYSGPIGAIITPQLWGINRAKELPYASSLCGACKDVCPVKINIPKILLALRSQTVESGSGKSMGGTIERIAFKIWRFFMQHKILYGLATKTAYYMQLPLSRSGDSRFPKISKLPFPFSDWTDTRDFPSIAKKTFRERWKEIRQ